MRGMAPADPRPGSPRTLVAFHAHPDDESLLTAGTMAKAAAEGHRVVLVVATAGEVGDADASTVDTAGLGVTRMAELRKAAEILGVARVELLGYRDSGSGPVRPVGGDGVCFADADVDEAAAKLAAILTEEQADVLTTYDRNGGYGHPDHRQVHAVGFKAAALARTPTVLEATFNRDLLKVGVGMVESMGYELPPGFTRPDSFDDWYTPAGELTHVIDVSDHLDAKRAAMEAHHSQTTSSSADGVRTLSLLLALPDEWFRMAFATEWYLQPGRPPGTPITDIFDPGARAPEQGADPSPPGP
jgi:LmbE family N-acetylglucosaminyl deacetylase